MVSALSNDILNGQKFSFKLILFSILKEGAALPLKHKEPKNRLKLFIEIGLKASAPANLK